MDICSDIELMRNNLELLACLFESKKGEKYQEEPDHEEIMKLYGVNRMIKEKMLMGNDEIVKYLKGSQGSTQLK